MLLSISLLLSFSLICLSQIIQSLLIEYRLYVLTSYQCSRSLILHCSLAVSTAKESILGQSWFLRASLADFQFPTVQSAAWKSYSSFNIKWVSGENSSCGCSVSAKYSQCRQGRSTDLCPFGLKF